ncbi:MAG: heme-binding protein [Myxococcales bacterium]|nr:MAG: heme-binding protein [Myxococcales bacterium]
MQAVVNRIESAVQVPLISSPTRARAPSVTASPVARAGSVVAPLASALAGAILLGRGGRAKPAGLALLGASVGALLARWQLGRAFYSTPTYKKELRLGRIELRRYAPHLRATTWVDASTWSEALSDGFQRLADYLFGANEYEERLAMTTPVLLSMPASSAQRRNGESFQAPGVATVPQLNGPARRQMAFVLPAERTLEDLPRPKDRRVVLSTVPAQRVAALAFRGSYGGDLPAHKRNELLFLVKCAGLKPVSEVWFAAYDGPSTLPVLRHSEVLVEVEA